MRAFSRSATRAPAGLGVFVPSGVESSCRAVFAQLQSALPLGQAPVIGVTGPGRSVGRTTVALGLALAASTQIGPDARVLLVDCDLENPTLAQRCGVQSQTSLARVLAAEVPFAEAIVPIRAGVWLLPAGATTPNPVRQLKELEESEFLSRLGAYFDAVVVDLPPLQTSTIGDLPSGLVPQLCIVARAGFTRQAELQRALGVFSDGGVGAVLLNARRQRIPRWMERLVDG